MAIAKQLPTPSLNNLTLIQLRIARFIQAFISEHHFAPSAREVDRAIKTGGPSGALGHLYRLERKGVIGRKHAVPRAMWINQPWLPLLAAPEADVARPLDAAAECEPMGIGEPPRRGPLLQSGDAEA